MFYFHPCGDDEQFDAHIFQMGGENQLENRLSFVNFHLHGNFAIVTFLGWESNGTPPMPPPPGNKALLRDY